MSPKLFKVKTGRWRGAIWIDPDDGQRWLVAAGYRKAGDNSDFYRDLLSRTSSDSGELLPTDADRKRHRQELRNAHVDAWEQQIVVDLLESIRTTRSGTNTASFEIPRLDIAQSLAHVEMQIDADEQATQGSEEYVQLTIAFSNWEASDELDVALDIMRDVICPDPQRWDITPAGEVRYLSVLAASAELDVLAVLADSPSADFGEDRPIGHPPAPTVAHFVATGKIPRSVVDGDAIRALCGQWFVSTSVPDNLPVCVHCAVVQRLKNQPTS